MRISVDLPAPLGPSRPYIPAGIVSETSFSACTPLGYVLETPRICNVIAILDGLETSVTGVAVLVDLERQAGFRHFGREVLAFPANYLDCFRL